MFARIGTFASNICCNKIANFSYLSCVKACIFVYAIHSFTVYIVWIWIDVTQSSLFIWNWRVYHMEWHSLSDTSDNDISTCTFVTHITHITHFFYSRISIFEPLFALCFLVKNLHNVIRPGLTKYFIFGSKKKLTSCFWCNPKRKKNRFGFLIDQLVI